MDFFLTANGLMAKEVARYLDLGLDVYFCTILLYAALFSLVISVYDIDKHGSIP